MSIYEVAEVNRSCCTASCMRIDSHATSCCEVNSYKSLNSILADLAIASFVLSGALSSVSHSTSLKL